MKAVDVLLPIHGDAPYLPETLESIALQSYKGDIKVLCILDRASPSVEILLRSWSKKLKIITLISDLPGISNALNVGLEHSRAEILVRIDADDVMDSQRISLQIEYLLHHNLGILGSDVTLIDDSKKKMGEMLMPKGTNLVNEYSKFANPFVHSSVCILRSIVNPELNYRSFYEPAEDFDLWLRVLQISSGDNLDYKLTSYRIHNQQISQTSRRRQIIAREAALESHRLRSMREPEIHEEFDSIESWLLSLRNKRSCLKFARILIESNFSNRTESNFPKKLCTGLILAIFSPKSLSLRSRVLGLSWIHRGNISK